MEASSSEHGSSREGLMHARLASGHPRRRHPGAAAHRAGRGRTGRVAAIGSCGSADAERLLLLLLAVVSWGRSVGACAGVRGEKNVWRQHREKSTLRTEKRRQLVGKTF